MKMDLETLKDTPPWDWPEGAGQALLDILRDDRTTKSDLLLASRLAGDYTVINDELAAALISVVQSGDKSEEVRGQAAISLGPVLEQADTDGFEDNDDLPITEGTFHTIQEALHRLYVDGGVPKEVRRRVLEASARAPQDWHQDAVRAVFSSNDRAWKLTAVFCMRFVPGFEDQVLESLDSADPEIHYEAVIASGNWGIDAAWPHVLAIATSEQADKALLLAAIQALADIRPHEAADTLDDLADSDDEDIVTAVEEARAFARLSDEDDEVNDG